MSHLSLQFDDVSYRYPNGRAALRGVSFRLEHGERTALVGINGSGKSTLLLHADGLLRPDAGRVIVDGIAVSTGTMRSIRRRVGLVFQNPDDQLFMPTVEEDVAFGPANMGLCRDEIGRRVTAALDAVGASGLRKSAPCHLSGGQKKSVVIATVLAMEPSLLVLDEPTSALDPAARRRIMELIRGFRHTTLVATHDLELVWALCARTIVMYGGRIEADGPTRAVFADRALLARCGLEQPLSMRLSCGAR